MASRIGLLLLVLLYGGCSIVDPLVYKLPKQQGNITSYKEVDKLELGMNKAQVKFIMGTPMAVDSFNIDRWDYAYTYKSPGGDWTYNNVTLTFEGGKLSKIEGAPLVKPTETDDEEEVTGQS